MSNRNKMASDLALAKIVNKAAKRNPTRASAYSRMSKGSSFGTSKLPTSRFQDEESFYGSEFSFDSDKME